jgi:hypothetical protein
MRYASVASGIAILVALLAPIAASASQNEFLSRAAVIEWIDNYRNKPEPSRVPDAVHALSTSGGLREPETAGFYVGFVAGVLGANPTEAEHLVVNMLPLPPADQWLVVRAIAYSGLPAWKSLLARVAAKVPARRGMIDAYLTGALPTLDTIELDKGPTFLEKSRLTLRRQAQGTGGVLRAQSRAGRHAVGQVFRRRPVPADLVHHHAAALVERSRQRRAAHGRQRGKIYPRQQRRALPRPDGADQGQVGLSGGRRVAHPQGGDPRRRDLRNHRHPQGTVGAGRKAQEQGRGLSEQRVVLATMSLGAAGLPCVIGGQRRRRR